MGTQYLIDSNAVIEFLSGALPEVGNNWMQLVIEKGHHHLSVINQIELLGYNGTPKEMKPLEDFIQYSNILPLSEDVALKTIELRKTNKIKLPDAIIAATAMVFDLTLVTRNIADFDKIEGLKCRNPHQI
jgi:predicted nucleic acid-binding protein